MFLISAEFPLKKGFEERVFIISADFPLKKGLKKVFLISAEFPPIKGCEEGVCQNLSGARSPIGLRLPVYFMRFNFPFLTRMTWSEMSITAWSL